MIYCFRNQIKNRTESGETVVMDDEHEVIVEAIKINEKPNTKLIQRNQ